MQLFTPVMRDRVVESVRQFARQDMRWSYWAVGVLVLVGLILNQLLPYGWTVWPFVVTLGLMMRIHEAAERNGQGVPPGHAYGFAGGALMAWLLMGALLSAINIYVLILGFIGVSVYALRGYSEGRQRERVYRERRKEGLCVHCGMRFTPGMDSCDHCGEEPDPLSTQLARVANIARNRRNVDRTRAVIKQDAIATVAGKERALLARRPRHSTRRITR